MSVNDKQPLSIEWLAGFYEGEGTPVVANSIVFQLSISQKERNILDTIRNTFGGSVYPMSKKSTDMYRWYLGSKAAVALALDLLKYMHSLYKIEQLTKTLILAGHMKPRNSPEEAGVISFQQESKARGSAAHKSSREKHREEYRIRETAYREGHKDERKRWQEQHVVTTKEYNQERNAEAKAVRGYLRTHPEVEAAAQAKLNGDYEH